MNNNNEYKTCPDCCYDILDDEGDVMDHECISDNEMIAEFMGVFHQGIFPPVTIGEQMYTLDELQYDTSWDWLIPVAHKLEGGGLDPHELINEALWRSPLEINDLYEVVLHLIKIHNNDEQ